ncbi:hypothetical protein BHYA_0520g00020 [Botrytis hyacinthi]|uniref:Uncharacterized protein n=1 Tax=Botrytis hyacinthi TaxID=278943 RepID=A0A4Z1GC15_9HELO|nr:hypothetical protein BHYA_0520g00020 [Botrytis hyacinthi]
MGKDSARYFLARFHMKNSPRCGVKCFEELKLFLPAEKFTLMTRVRNTLGLKPDRKGNQAEGVLYVKVITRARREESSTVKLPRTIIEYSYLTSSSPTLEPTTCALGESKSILAEKMTLKQCSKYTKCNALVIAANGAPMIYKQIIAQRSMRVDSVPDLDIFLNSDDKISHYPFEKTYAEARYNPLIMHTSGSTEFPNPAFVKHRTWAFMEA